MKSINLFVLSFLLFCTSVYCQTLQTDVIKDYSGSHTPRLNIKTQSAYNSTVWTGFNADLLDGLNSTDFLRDNSFRIIQGNTTNYIINNGSVTITGGGGSVNTLDVTGSSGLSVSNNGSVIYLYGVPTTAVLASNAINAAHSTNSDWATTAVLASNAINAAHSTNSDWATTAVLASNAINAAHSTNSDWATTAVLSSNALGLTALDGTITNLSDIPFVIPYAAMVGLSNRYYNATNTAFVSASGVDGTAVLGDPALPSATFTNAYNLLPAWGGCIWWLGSNYTDNATPNNFLINKNTAVVQGNNILGQAGLYWITVNSNLSWWGGQVDLFFSTQNATESDFHYLRIGRYPSTLNIDAILGTGNVWLDHCFLSSAWDDVNCSSPAGTLTLHANDCVFFAKAKAGNDARCISFQPTITGPSGSYYYIKDSLLVACGAAGVYQNLCVSWRPYTGYGTLVLDNVQMITGYTNSWQIFVSPTSDNAAFDAARVRLKNMPVPPLNQIFTNRAGQVAALGSLGSLNMSGASGFSASNSADGLTAFVYINGQVLTNLDVTGSPGLSVSNNGSVIYLYGIPPTVWEDSTGYQSTSTVVVADYTASSGGIIITNIGGITYFLMPTNGFAGGGITNLDVTGASGLSKSNNNNIGYIYGIPSMVWQDGTGFASTSSTVVVTYTNTSGSVIITNIGGYTHFIMPTNGFGGGGAGVDLTANQTWTGTNVFTQPISAPPSSSNYVSISVEADCFSGPLYSNSVVNSQVLWTNGVWEMKWSGSLWSLNASGATNYTSTNASIFVIADWQNDGDNCTDVLYGIDPLPVLDGTADLKLRGGEIVYGGGATGAVTTAGNLTVGGVLNAATLTGNGSGLTNVGLTTAKVSLSLPSHMTDVNGTYSVANPDAWENGSWPNVNAFGLTQYPERDAILAIEPNWATSPAYSCTNNNNILWFFPLGERPVAANTVRVTIGWRLGTGQNNTNHSWRVTYYLRAWNASGTITSGGTVTTVHSLTSTVSVTTMNFTALSGVGNTVLVLQPAMNVDPYNTNSNFVTLRNLQLTKPFTAEWRP